MWPAIFTSRPCRIFNFSDELRTYGFYKVHSSSNFQKKCIKVTENCHFIVYVQFDMNSFNRMMIHCLNLSFFNLMPFPLCVNMSGVILRSLLN